MKIREFVRKYDYPLMLLLSISLLLVASYVGNLAVFIIALVLIASTMIVEHKLDRNLTDVEVKDEDESSNY